MLSNRLQRLWDRWLSNGGEEVRREGVDAKTWMYRFQAGEEVYILFLCPVYTGEALKQGLQLRCLFFRFTANAGTCSVNSTNATTGHRLRNIMHRCTHNRREQNLLFSPTKLPLRSCMLGSIGFLIQRRVALKLNRANAASPIRHHRSRQQRMAST